MRQLVTLRRLMTFSALVACPYGLLCLFFPGQWLRWISDLELSGQGLLVARMYGTQVFGFGATSWLARKTPDSAARRALIKGFVVVDAASLLLAIWAITQGWVGPQGWIDVLGFGFFVIAFGAHAVAPSDEA